MSTARKYAANQRSMPSESRRSAYAAINIIWLQMRPDLRFESKETIREERLAWMESFLQLRRPLASSTELSDRQLGLVIEEMKRLSGQPSIKKPESTTKSGNSQIVNNSQSADIVHLASEEQVFTIGKLVAFIGWTDIQKANYIKKRFGSTTERMLKFADCNALMMQLLNIAAHKDLKRLLGKDEKITRKMTAQHIPLLKRKLGIER